MVLDGLWPQSISDGASFLVTAELPDGATEPLLWVYQYKPRASRIRFCFVRRSSCRAAR